MEGDRVAVSTPIRGVLEIQLVVNRSKAAVLDLRSVYKMVGVGGANWK